LVGACFHAGHCYNRCVSFRWDWLSPVISAPYVPTLGPVRPQALSADLFKAVIAVAGTGRFLPYDKDRRWSSKKDEHVLVNKIIQRPGLTVIPTLSTRGRGLLKIHHYGDDRPDVAQATEWARAWSPTPGVGAARLIWFEDAHESARTRLMLKTFGDQDSGHRGPAMHLTDCPYASTFAAFADEIGPEGFTFLHQRMEAGIDDGPVLVTVEDDRIVGAIGPLATMTDAAGVVTQPPQYFAVHPDYRGRGHGRALWRASMAWGKANGAQHKILQASAGTAAEGLYLSEGLATLGFTRTADLPS
jgi:GNAT superfamily N-acetyltransferase